MNPRQQAPGFASLPALGVWVRAAALAVTFRAAAHAAQGSEAPRASVLFCGDFEQGNLAGWRWDFARSDSARVVSDPVRRGRHAVEITLKPGDVAALKNRAELMFKDKQLELVHARPGAELWYGWSVLVPADDPDPRPGNFHILGQWHGRPARAATAATSASQPERRAPRRPTLALHFKYGATGYALNLYHHPGAAVEGHLIATRAVRKGEWIDLVFHVKWSEGKDGFVEAWLDGKPYTAGKVYGATLQNPAATYLRLGLYRPHGGETTNRVYLDEVRVGDSYAAVAP